MSKLDMTANRFTFRWALALLLASFMLVLVACSGETETTPAAQTTIVDQLRKNAEDFEYTIGMPGGTRTLATVSEPLTFNLDSLVTRPV